MCKLIFSARQRGDHFWESRRAVLYGQNLAKRARHSQKRGVVRCGVVRCCTVVDGGVVRSKSRETRATLPKTRCRAAWCCTVVSHGGVVRPKSRKTRATFPKTRCRTVWCCTVLYGGVRWCCTVQISRNARDIVKNAVSCGVVLYGGVAR